MNRLFLALSAVALVVSAACSHESPAPATATTAETAQKPAPPTPQEARAIVEEAPEFAEFEFTNAGYSIPVAGAAMNDVTRGAARDLAREGWVGLDGDGNLVLTSKAEGDKRFLLRPNGILDVVPLAKKEMGEVVAVEEQEDGTVIADFRWRWIPNEVGTAFRSGPPYERFTAGHTGRATLMWNGSSWVVLKIESR